MNNQARTEIERKIVRRLLRVMKSHGWDAIAVDDGGKQWEPTRTEGEVLDFVFGVDESSIKFRKQIDSRTRRTHSAYIILGNDGYDCIYDYTYNESDDFASIMEKEVDPYVEKLEGKLSQS